MPRQIVQILAAGPQVVASGHVGRQRQVVAERVDLLADVLREVVAAADGEAAQRDDGRQMQIVGHRIARGGQAGGRVPLGGRVHQPSVARVSGLELVERPAADDARQRTLDRFGVLVEPDGIVGVIDCAADRRLRAVVRLEIAPGIARHAQARLARQLRVHASHRFVLRARGRQVDVEARIGRVVRDRVRLALELVVGEVVHLVAANRPAHRHADLLIRVRQHAVLHEILRVHAIAAEIPGQRA